MTSTTLTNRILPATRAVAALVIPFLAVAFIILFLLPEYTGELFAWKIQPTMSAMMLGATYAGGIYFFASLLREKKWHRVKIGFLPTAVFVTFLGLDTLLHWDRFNHQHISFFAWAGLYFTTPFIVLAVWWLNRGQDTGQPDEAEVLFPRPARVVMGLIGVTTLAISLFLFVQPALMVAVWPWTLTPLTARVVGAMFALPGMVGLAWQWIAAGAWRAAPQFNWDNPGSWLFVGGLDVMWLGLLGLLVLMPRLASKNMTR